MHHKNGHHSVLLKVLRQRKLPSDRLCSGHTDGPVLAQSMLNIFNSYRLQGRQVLQLSMQTRTSANLTKTELKTVSTNGTVDLCELQKVYPNGYVATEDVNLHIPGGTFFTLLGPSGCGKTTLLRMIAGFEEPSAGEILLNGHLINGLPAFRRPVNTVFQSYVLFPHLNVYQNVEFGLRMRRIKSAQRANKVEAILESMQLSAFAKHMPAQLSGGQKQRVALARALVNEPEVLLLDEPLSALDAKLRRELQIELLRLQKTVGTTFIFVTHDQNEAMIMSEHVGIMRQGRLQQVGSIRQVYEHPRTVFVARFFGLPNIIRSESLAYLPTLPENTKHVMIHPEHIKFGNQSTEHTDNTIHGVIKERLYMGGRTDYIVAAEAMPDLLVSDSGINHASRMIGSPAHLSIPARKLVPLED